MNCWLLRKKNIPPIIQRRIEQALVRLKTQIEEKEAKENNRSNNEPSSGPPYPRAPFNPRSSRTKLDTPKVTAITTQQREAYKNTLKDSQNEEQTQSPQEQNSMTEDETAIINDFQQLLVGSMNGEAIELATPIAAKVNHEGLIDDFQDQDNIILIHAEFEDPLIPSDYDAYGGGALNW